MASKTPKAPQAQPEADDTQPAAQIPNFLPATLDRARERAAELLDVIGLWVTTEAALARQDATVTERLGLVARLVTTKRRAHRLLNEVVRG